MSKRQLKKTQILAGAVLGTPRRRTREFKRVVEALEAGKTDVVVEIPWGGGHFQQLLLQRLQGDRVYFHNPYKGGDLASPFARQAEPDGTESALLRDLEAHFVQGKGEALLP